jgi:predicted MFS family arabinose efflux permease
MTASDARTGGLAPLRVPDFRLLLGGFALGQLLMPLQFLTQILWMQEFAPKDVWLILVALIGASRGVGALTFGLYGGALADRFDRRQLLLATQGLQLVTTVGIAALMFVSAGGAVAFALFFFLTFLHAGLQSIDAPTRLAIVPDILGPDLTPAGISLNQAAAQLAMPVGMFATGFIVHAFGFGGAYLLSAVGHVVTLVFLALMSYRAAARRGRPGRYGLGEALHDVREGLAYARHHPLILGVIVLVVTMMSLGFPAVANLGPTWVTTVVGVPIKNVGYVVMWWGLGALVAALALARFSSIERRGALIGGGAVLFALSFVVFVADHTELNVAVGNFGIGVGMTVATVSSTILIQQLVPNEVRGRLMSIFQLNMGFAQLMTLPIAALGQWLTLPVLFPGLAALMLASVLLILIVKPDIVRARSPASYGGTG